MSSERYIELHARSAFSFLRGAATPEELVAACSELEMPAMALLDNDGVYGAARFHLAAQKLKVKAQIGAEVSVRLNSASYEEASMSAVGAADNRPGRQPGDQNDHLIRALEEGDRVVGDGYASTKTYVAPKGA